MVFMVFLVFSHTSPFLYSFSQPPGWRGIIEKFQENYIPFLGRIEKSVCKNQEKRLSVGYSPLQLSSKLLDKLKYIFPMFPMFFLA